MTTNLLDSDAQKQQGQSTMLSCSASASIWHGHQGPGPHSISLTSPRVHLRINEAGLLQSGTTIASTRQATWDQVVAREREVFAMQGGLVGASASKAMTVMAGGYNQQYQQLQQPTQHTQLGQRQQLQVPQSHMEQETINIGGAHTQDLKDLQFEAKQARQQQSQQEPKARVADDGPHTTASPTAAILEQKVKHEDLKDLAESSMLLASDAAAQDSIVKTQPSELSARVDTATEDEPSKGTQNIPNTTTTDSNCSSKNSTIKNFQAGITIRLRHVDTLLMHGEQEAMRQLAELEREEKGKQILDVAGIQEPSATPDSGSLSPPLTSALAAATVPALATATAAAPSPRQDNAPVAGNDSTAKDEIKGGRANLAFFNSHGVFVVGADVTSHGLAKALELDK